VIEWDLFEMRFVALIHCSVTVTLLNMFLGVYVIAVNGEAVSLFYSFNIPRFLLSRDFQYQLAANICLWGSVRRNCNYSFLSKMKHLALKSCAFKNKADGCQYCFAVLQSKFVLCAIASLPSTNQNPPFRL
jgi:hypothetical protein